MWIVDTCVVLDVLENDAQFGLPSAQLLESLLPEGLAVSPITFMELSPAFGGNLEEQKHFLNLAGILHQEPWTSADTEITHASWHRYVTARRAKSVPKRPIADLMIGGFAQRRSGLVTRNPQDFRPWYPDLSIQSP